MAGDLTCHRAHYDVIAMSVVAVSPLGGAWQHRLKATSCGRNWCRGRVNEACRLVVIVMVPVLCVCVCVAHTWETPPGTLACCQPEG